MNHTNTSTTSDTLEAHAEVIDALIVVSFLCGGKVMFGLTYQCLCFDRSEIFVYAFYHDLERSRAKRRVIE